MPFTEIQTAGHLRHRVTLANPTRTADTAHDGGYTETFSNLTPPRVWADIAPASAGDIERQVGSTVEGKVSHLVTIRYHSGVTLKTRVTFGSRTFQVVGIQNIDERNIMQQLACMERVS